MNCKTPQSIVGAWVVKRIQPYDGSESILGLFPEGKAALLKLQHYMDTPEDYEEYTIEYRLFRSYEQEIETMRRSEANRREWAEKDRLYEESMNSLPKVDYSDLLEDEERLKETTSSEALNEEE